MGANDAGFRVRVVSKHDVLRLIKTLGQVESAPK
jgi:hypothetical protein